MNRVVIGHLIAETPQEHCGVSIIEGFANGAISVPSMQVTRLAPAKFKITARKIGDGVRGSRHLHILCTDSDHDRVDQGCL
jgi:hypothetical protein